MAITLDDLFGDTPAPAPKPKKEIKPPPAPVVEELPQTTAPKKTKMGEKSVQPDAHTRTPIPTKLYPKKHPEGSLKLCDQVWYRGVRHWIEEVHDHWEEGVHVMLSDMPLAPNRPAPKERTRFAVHADLVELAPVTKNPYMKQPTMADVQRKERAKAGVRDVGDKVATLLRGAKDLDDVYRIAAQRLYTKPSTLKMKYGHLNPGQQRMCLGNALRNQMKKERKS
jgi:hypothetical protein